MSIQTEAELAALREVGRIVRLALDAMESALRPGMTTQELADIGGNVMRENGARSAPALVMAFLAMC